MDGPRLRLKRAPAFWCPDRAWVQYERFNIGGAHGIIDFANYDRDERRGYEEPGVVSPMEVDLLAAMWLYKLYPEPQYPVGAFDADFCFPDDRLAVEVDGREWHVRERDELRDRVFRDRHGITTLRFTGQDVWRDPLFCARSIRWKLAILRRERKLAAA